MFSLKSFLAVLSVPAALLALMASDPARAYTAGAQQAAPAAETRYALLVGVENYKKVGGFTGGPNRDVCTLRRVLITVAGFKPENITVLATPGSCPKVETVEPTKEAFDRALGRLTNAMPRGSLFLLAFSGHGVKQGAESYLLMQDSTRVGTSAPTRAVAVGALAATLARSRVPPERVLLLLDACRDSGNSGGAVTGSRPASLKRAFAGRVGKPEGVRTVSVLYSASPGEKSFVRSTGPVSIFTWAIIRGLIGEAAEADGQIKVGRLAEYVEKEVPELRRFDLLRMGAERRRPDSAGLQQQPQAEHFGVGAGDYVLARAPLPRLSFFYSVEAFILPKSPAGKQAGTLVHKDLVSPRPLNFLDETLPLDVDLVEAPLTVIKIPYTEQVEGEVATWDYLVRFTFHYGRWHKSFIFCPSSPQVPERGNAEIKTYFADGALVVDALRSFSMWGHCLRDVDACLGEDEENVGLKISYTRHTNCLAR